MIAPFGNLERRATDGAHLRLRALGEIGDLRAGVVVVELAIDVPAGDLEQRTDGVAEGGLTAVTDVQRAGGIGRHELHDHARAMPDVEPSEGVGRLENGEQSPRLKTGIEPEVEKARAGDFRGGHPDAGLVHRGDERFGDVARLLAERLRERHGEIGGPVAERRITRAFENGRNVVGRTKRARCARQFGAQGVGVSHRVRDVGKENATPRRISRRTTKTACWPTASTRSYCRFWCRSWGYCRRTRTRRRCAGLFSRLCRNR